jgi:hypothetical protein
MSREGVHIIAARRLNAMQAVCDTARIWSRSQGDDKSRAEQSLLRALATWEESQREEEVSEGATHA